MIYASWKDCPSCEGRGWQRADIGTLFFTWRAPRPEEHRSDMCCYIRTCPTCKAHNRAVANALEGRERDLATLGYIVSPFASVPCCASCVKKEEQLQETKRTLEKMQLQTAKIRAEAEKLVAEFARNFKSDLSGRTALDRAQQQINEINRGMQNALGGAGLSGLFRSN